MFLPSVVCISSSILSVENFCKQSNFKKINFVSCLVGSAFVPPPDVDVGVVTFRPKVEPVIKEDFHFIEKVVRQMTTYRQKRCIRSAEYVTIYYTFEYMKSSLSYFVSHIL